MQLTVMELEDGIKKITLQGRMDIDGTQKIDTRFTVATASESANVIVDLSGVDFISSIGIGVLVRSANALKLRQGKIVVLNPQPSVFKVLEATQINTVIPIVFDMESARALLKS
jgi:anti-sigma B factor antagonist